jgi:hypothetical protein
MKYSKTPKDISILMEAYDPDDWRKIKQDQNRLRELEQQIVNRPYDGPGFLISKKYSKPWTIKGIEYAHDPGEGGDDDRSRFNFLVGGVLGARTPTASNPSTENFFHVAVSSKIIDELLNATPDEQLKILHDIISAFGATNTVLKWRNGIVPNFRGSSRDRERRGLPPVTPDELRQKEAKWNAEMGRFYKVLVKYELHSEEEDWD